MMQTAAAAVAMAAAAWQTEQRATCDSTRLWRRQLGQVIRTATSAVFFCRCHCFYSLSFSHFLLLFLLFFWRIFLSFWVCVTSGWRCGSCLAKGFPFSKRTHLHSQHFAKAAAAVCVIVCVCVGECVCQSVSMATWRMLVFFAHCRAFLADAAAAQLRVQPTIDGTAIL